MIEEPADHRMPRWVKIFAVAGGVAVLLIVIMLLSGHGPGRHTGQHQGIAAAAVFQ